MKIIARILSIFLTLGAASYANPGTHHEKLESVKNVLSNPQQGWSLRPILNRIKGDAPTNLQELQNPNGHGTRFLEEFHRYGASLFNDTNQLTPIEKFWAYLLMKTVTKELSLENFTAFLDHPVFGQIPRSVVKQGFQVFCGEAPIYKLLIERGHIDTNLFEESKFLLLPRCEIASLKRFLPERTLPDQDVNTMNDYELSLLLEQPKGTPEQTLNLQIPHNKPLIFWALERYRQNHSLVLFEKVYPYYRGEIHNDRTILEEIFFSGDNELISYIVQVPYFQHFSWLILFNKTINLTPNRPILCGDNDHQPMWEKYLQEHRSNLEQQLNNARKHDVIKLEAYLSENNSAWEELMIYQRHPEFYDYVPQDGMHMLEVALRHGVDVYSAVVRKSFIKITQPTLAERLFTIAEQMDISYRIIVKAIDKAILPKMSNQKIKEDLQRRCPQLKLN